MQGARSSFAAGLPHRTRAVVVAGIASAPDGRRPRASLTRPSAVLRARGPPRIEHFFGDDAGQEEELCYRRRVTERARRACVFGVASALALAAVAAGCRSEPQPPPGPRLVILYATCTVNRQHLAPYAPDVTYTPNLARFAAQARVFDRHQTEEGMSGPAFASLLTGTQADRHGIFTHPARLADSNQLLMEAFAAAGWETWFFGDHPIAAADLGYAQGVPPHRIKQELLSGDSASLAHILTRLREDPRRRALIVTAFTVSHGPYALDRLPGFCERHSAHCVALGVDEIERLGKLYQEKHFVFERSFDETIRAQHLSPRQREALVAAVDAIYTSRIEYLDSLFGGLVGAIEHAGLTRDSLVAFTADHGEILYRANAPFKWTHGYMLEPEDLTAPLVLRGPGVTPGRYAGVTRSIDVFPTLAALAGVPVKTRSVDGVDLSPAVRDAVAPPNLPALSHTMLVPHEVYERSGGWLTLRRYFRELDAPGMWVAVRERDLFARLRWERECPLAPEVYDLSADPGLTTNLYDAASPEHRRLIDALRAYKARLVRAYTQGVTGAATADNTEGRLESLGYIDKSAPITTSAPRPSTCKP